ncbi:glycosyltransferase family 39 protein [Microbacterium sp. P5_E9]
MLELHLPRTPTTTRSRMRKADPALTLGAIGVVVGFTGSWIPSYWGDEAASVMSASRPLDGLVTELSRVDAVHGVYYALLHVWISLFGTSELATRLPSAIAVGLMVAGTVMLAREFAGPRLAILAGIVCIVLPRSTYLATEARSYAFAAAAAVWLTVLLVRALREGSGSRWWWAYTAAIAAGIYLFLYLGLLLIVHGGYVALLHRRSRAYVRGWALAAARALALAAPIVLVAYLERKQIRFLEHRDYATVAHVLTSQWFGAAPAAILAWALILVAALWFAATATRRRTHAGARGALTILTLLWLVVPTGLVLIGNAFVAPLYNVRYLSFSTPAAAILIALGISAVMALFAPARQTLVGGLLVVLLIALCLPVYVGQRTPWAKDGGSDLRGAAAFVHDHAALSDVVLFDQSTKPSRDPRLALNLYPSDFAGLDDVALKTPYVERRGLWDAVYPNRDIGARLGSTDVWAIELPATSAVPDDVAFLIARGYQVESVDSIHRTVVYHLIDD